MKRAALSADVMTELKRSSETANDIRILHEILPNLCDEGVLAVYFRFWECMTIQEIARILGISWDRADRLIENSIQDLRQGFANRKLNTRRLTAA